MAVRVLVVGLGNMGRSHALAYHRHPGFEIVGLVNRRPPQVAEELQDYPVRSEYEAALREFRPDLVSINTYSDTHADYAVMALEQGAHVFVEKPLATTVADAERVVAAAVANGRKLVVGYILRHHPSWMRFIEEARKMGGPYAFRLNLNQQSSGPSWAGHKRLMETTSPIVDCAVHYVDVMCQITDALPVEVRGMGVRLSDELVPDMYNYGALQVLFADGSVGWYEAAWGPMVSDTAFFVKDVMSPNGSVSIVMEPGAKSDELEVHTRTDQIKVHRARSRRTAHSRYRMSTSRWPASRATMRSVLASRTMSIGPSPRILTSRGTCRTRCSRCAFPLQRMRASALGFR